MQENEKLLWKVSEILNAPLEKLEKTTERLVKEWKETRREKKRLLKEIAKREALKLEARTEVRKTKPIHGVKFVTQQFEQINTDFMIKTASELVKRNPEVVAVFHGVERKTARIVVMAGKDAVKRGVNSGEIAGEAASVLGGGGSGRPDFAQGGGTRVKKVPDALQKAEEVIKKQLERES